MLGPAHQLPMLSSLSPTVSSNLGPIFWFILAKVIYVDTHNQTEISMAEGASCSPSQRKVFLELELINYFVEGSLSHVNDLNLTSILCMTNYIIVDKNILKKLHKCELTVDDSELGIGDWWAGPKSGGITRNIVLWILLGNFLARHVLVPVRPIERFLRMIGPISQVVTPLLIYPMLGSHQLLNLK